MPFTTVNTSAEEYQASEASANDTSLLRLTYRPDIEGLRAVAIIIVVACHAGFAGFPGGFSGVDIFFVLSGFLITGLLTNEIKRTGKISLLDFYARRLKRLLPALLLMTLVTLVLAAILLAPAEQAVQARTAEAVPLWLSNFHFSFSAVDYFATEANSNLFLHTWSLAVEEQFYLLWPILVLLLCGAFGVNGVNANSPNLVRGLAFTIVLVFLLSLFLSHVKPLWGFYLMPARAWQFALGGLVFVLSSRDSNAAVATLRRKNPDLLYSLAGWTGLILIISGVVVLSETMIYPGYGALLPSLGAALLLFAGSSPKATLISRMLALPPLQAIGKLSYSWYLWHWPVLVLGSVVLPQGGFLQSLTLVLVSLVLAFISLHTVEAPIRHSRFLSRHSLLTVSLSLTLMFSVFALGKLWQQKAVEWSSLEELIAYQQVRNDLPILYSNGCDEWYATPRVRPCGYGNRDADKTAVLFGDSVGAQWFTALAQPLVEAGWQFVVLTKSACPIVDEPIFYARIGMEYTVCSEWRTASLRFLEELQPELVFIGSTSSYDYSHTQWLEGTRRVLEVLTPVTDRIYLVQGSYRLPFDGPDCLARQKWQPAFLQKFSDCSAYGPDHEDLTAAAALSQAAMGYANVGVLDLNPLICPLERCAAQQDEKIVFRDFQHIADSFVQSITSEVQSRIGDVKFNGASTGAER